MVPGFVSAPKTCHVPKPGSNPTSNVANRSGVIWIEHPSTTIADLESQDDTNRQHIVEQSGIDRSTRRYGYSSKDAPPQRRGRVQKDEKVVSGGARRSMALLVK